MRDVAAIWAAWKSGVYVGDTKPSTRVTIEKGWELRATGSTVGTWNKGPARWFQRQVTTKQIETEIPNVISVNISRSLTDASTCEFTVVDTVMPTYGEPESIAGQFGKPGFYNPDYGLSTDATARWRHVVNSWQDVLAPNALVRTYQGFGGHDKTIKTAVTDGNIVLNGVWLIDDINISNEGTISIKCRDMRKLLLDQQLFPPLVPANLYPLEYYRWKYEVKAIPAIADPSATGGGMCYMCSYSGSSTDAVYGGFNTAATGHPGSDAFDMSYEQFPEGTSGWDMMGNIAHQGTYWMSEPMGNPTDSVWIEFDVDAGDMLSVSQVYFHAWEGNLDTYTWGGGVYLVMVSVFENGQWAGPETAGGGVTAQGVPYVCAFVPGTENAPGESTNLYAFPRDYRASKIRLTLTNLVPAAEGGYRGGARKIMACFHSEDGRVGLPTTARAAASIPPNVDHHFGYWQARTNGEVYAFGDARVQTLTSPQKSPKGLVVDMAARADGLGYWLVDTAGRVLSAGTASHFGDLEAAGRSDVVGIAPNYDDAGYWLLCADGTVFNYGSAIHRGNSIPTGTLPTGAAVSAAAIASHGAASGYWIVHTSGAVSAHNVTSYGHATDRTGFADTEVISYIERTSNSTGYWVLSSGGKIQAKGSAPNQGNAALSGYEGNRWYKGLCFTMIPSSVNDNAYAIQSADGNLWVKGDPTGLSYGSVGSGNAMQRFDGNYKDYAEIIRDLLLWAGYYFYEVPQPTNQFPDLYGNIESTGAYAEDPLPREMFDKKPVMDPINEIREIVGYAAFVDAEGGFRFESPNWWSMGNYLIDGSPLNYMPEIDETVQLLSHSVTRSASQARSRLIIATEDPYPSIAGQEAPPGVLVTEIVPKTARDLRGLCVPAMWTNGKFLRPYEQRVMAELIDMKMWFARRQSSVSCVANPLIDVNDQVRVVERTTGEVYVHYISALSISHDLMSGEFTMDLTTHWLNGTPWGLADFAMACAALPGGDGYWQTTCSGEIYAFGDAELYERNEDDSHTVWMVSFRPTPSGLGYYTLDVSGKVITHGDAVHRGELYVQDRSVTDMALTPSGGGYWILQLDGTVTAFGDAVDYGHPTSGARVMPSGKEVSAEAIESHPVTQGYWVLWTDGVVNAYHLTHHGNANRVGYLPYESNFCLRRTPDGGGYYIPSSTGAQMQVFGNAVDHGASTPYPVSHWTLGVVWDMIVQADGAYALQHADRFLEGFDFTKYGEAYPRTDPVQWAIASPASELLSPDAAFQVSSELVQFLAGTESPSATAAIAANFGSSADDSMNGGPT